MADPAPDTSRAWTIHCDGSAIPNPGAMGLGAVLIAPDGTRHTLSQEARAKGCNNEAELRAMMAALRHLQACGAAATDAVRVYSDSSILVAQLGHAGTPPIARLSSLFDEARALLQAFQEVSLHWIPRHRNGEADALARLALGALPKP